MINDSLKALAEPIDTLALLPDNPRKGNVEAVANSLATFGQRKPIVARRGDKVVIAGNHTLQAARQLGWKQIAVVWVDDDDLTAKAFALADNRTAELGSYDDHLLADLILAVQREDANLLAMSGWDQQAVQDLLYIIDSGHAAPGVEPSDPLPTEFPGRSDDRATYICPQCAFQWATGPQGEIEPI